MMIMMMNSFARCSSLYIYAMRECCRARRQLEGGRLPTWRSRETRQPSLCLVASNVELKQNKGKIDADA